MSKSADSSQQPKRRGNPNWVKGKSGNPHGKPKGAIHGSKFLVTQAQAIARAGATPLEILVAMARRDPVALEKVGVPLTEVTPAVAHWALATALPYTARRMTADISLEVYRSDSQFSPLDKQILGFLTEQQVEAYQEIQERVADIKRRLDGGERYMRDAMQDNRLVFVDRSDPADTVDAECRAVVSRAASTP